MKKSVCLILAVLMLLPFASCGGSTVDTEAKDDTAEVEILDLTLPEYKVVYDLSDSNAIVLMTEFQNKVNEAVGIKPASLSSSNAPL